MKKVVSPETVAHMWANQTQAEARNANSTLYFSGNTIYSYGSHFPIGKHVENSEGHKAILFTTRSYSNTTSKHVSVVSRAANHKDFIYCYSPGNTHNDNFNSWIRDCESIAQNLKRARKPEIYLSQLGSVKVAVEKYAGFFGLRIPIVLQNLLSIENAEQYSKYAEQKHAFELAEQKRKEKELKKKLSEDLKDWRSFKKSRLYTRIGVDYLRFNSESNRVETSQNVEIPMEVAKIAFNWAIKTLENGGCKECNFKILNYDVTELTKSYIKIGCHKIETKEYMKLAAQMKW
jgi:hypothetical protein